MFFRMEYRLIGVVLGGSRVAAVSDPMLLKGVRRRGRRPSVGGYSLRCVQGFSLVHNKVHEVVDSWHRVYVRQLMSIRTS